MENSKNAEIVKILLVEDNKLLALTLKESLSFCFENLDVIYCEYPEQAIPYLKLNPDIVISDYQFGKDKMDGLKFIETARRLTPHSHFILTTSYTSDEIEKKAREIGVDFYFEKPFPISKLINSIKKLTPFLKEVKKIPSNL